MKTQKYLINGFEYSIWDDAFSKRVRSKVYNYNFNKTSGRFARWGITQEDDPDFAPAPEILDIEVQITGAWFPFGEGCEAMNAGQMGWIEVVICQAVGEDRGLKQAYIRTPNSPAGLGIAFEKAVKRNPHGAALLFELS